MRMVVRVALVLAAALGFGPVVRAQSAGTLSTRAQVLPAITINGRVLDFGTITGNQSATVAPTSNKAGRFELLGPTGTGVVFSIVSLPANFGIPTLTLGAWQGRHNSSPSANGGGSVAFTPSAGYSATYVLANPGRYYVWLGGTVTAAGAPAGTYTTPIVVSVGYF